MKRIILACFILSTSLPNFSWAQHEAPHNALQESAPEKLPSLGTAMSGQSNLDSNLDWPSPVDDEVTHTFLLTEVLEYQMSEGENEARWDFFGWHGGDYNRLWLKSEGRAATATTSGSGDLQVLYGRLISRYLDFQVGARFEQTWDSEDSEHTRTSASIGVQGLAPYYFDIEPTFFVSQDGEVSGRFTGTYDILLSQRLVLQPRLESIAAIQDNRTFGIGSGINDIEAGLRLRYEIKREFAPYIGVTFEKVLGETASYARNEGDDTQKWSLVAGLRLWF